MTVIISALTRQYVAMVSDRRTTWTEGKRVTRQEDTDTKTFNLYGQFLMGFTGIARIDNWRIERWAMEIFKDVPTEEYFNVLGKEITSVFRRLPTHQRIAHAFLAVGYATLSPGGQPYPLSVTISNCLNEHGLFAPPDGPAGAVFRGHVEPLGNRRQLIRSVGWPIHETAKQALNHRIRVVTRGDPGNPALAIGPLVMALRDTARRSNKHVGSAALFASLPRCAVPSPGMTMGQADYRRNAASLFLPEAAYSADEGIRYMPALISRELMITGIKIYSSVPKEPLGQEEGFR